jgi:inosine-uridine nucleoside N-ribohydrolase
MLIHLDSDFGGDPDDACALAFLLASPMAEILAITTSLDHKGERAGCVSHYLKLAGRSGIPVAAGADRSLSKPDFYLSTANDPRYWPESPTPRPSPIGTALDLLSQSIQRGATIVVIGPPTNLALLEAAKPHSLDHTQVVFMGGWVNEPLPGLPPWGPSMDFNVQCDTEAALALAIASNLTLVTLPATLKAHLRASHLPRLRNSGPVGKLLALQSQLHSSDNHMSELARSHTALPDDLVNFHYDPVACAVALAWPGATVEEMHLIPIFENGVLRFQRSAGGRPARVVTDINGNEFAEYWLGNIEALQTAGT